VDISENGKFHRLRLAAITAPSGHEQGNQAFQYQKPTVMEGKQVAAPLL
jgi:hypothetical protein